MRAVSDAPPPSDESTSPSNSGLFDFRARSAAFTSGYLDTFYRHRPPTNDEQAVLRFLVRQIRGMPSGQLMIEVGCGPTVHHALPFVPRVSAIHMADYLAENLVEIDRWRHQLPGAMDWSQYTKLVLDLEGRPTSWPAVPQRESDLRNRIARLVHADLQREQIFGEPLAYPIVGAFYCTEEVGVTLTAWEHVMGNLANAVAPGGRLFLACLRNTDQYLVGDVMFPCARVSEADVTRVLGRLDFDMTQTVVEASAVAGQEQEGVVGVVLADAIKRGSSSAPPPGSYGTADPTRP